MNALVFNIALGILLFSGCVTTEESSGRLERFPRAFVAEQTVFFEAGDKKTTLLAQVEHTPDRTRVVFIHPTLQSPIVILAGDDETLDVEWRMAPPEEAKERLEEHIDQMFRSMRRVFLTGEGENYTFSESRDFGGCPFPGKVEVRLSGGGDRLIRILAEATSVECKER